MKSKIKPFVKTLALLSAIVCLALSSDSAMQAARNAASTCFTILLPSLFPFFVLSRMLIASGGANVLGRFCNWLMHPLFRINGNGAAAFLLGIISGYPVGAKTVTELYRKQALSKSEAENLLCFSNNSGPLFILGAVGIGMFSSQTVGLLLYAVHVLSAVTVGVLLRFTIPKPSIRTAATHHTANTNLLTTAVEDSVTTLLHVFGYVIFFAVVMQLLQDFHITLLLTRVFCFFNLPGGVIDSLFCGILELTTGIKKLSEALAPLSVQLIFTSGILGWAGLSVHFQVKGILTGSGLSFGKYLFGKGLQAIVAAVYTAVALVFVPLHAPTFLQAALPQPSAASAPVLLSLLSCALLILYAVQLICSTRRPKNSAQTHRAAIANTATQSHPPLD